MNTNRYSFIYRKSGKTANIKPVASRAQARDMKRRMSFTVAIWNNQNQSFVR